MPFRFSALKNAFHWLKKHANTIIFALLIALIIKQRFPAYQANKELENKPIFRVQLTTLDNSTVTFPPPGNQPLVAIAWYTWCVPCKVEMQRIQRAIQKGSLPANKIFAINLGEPIATVRSHVQQNNFSMPILIDSSGNFAAQLQLQVTPTYYLINSEGVVEWASSGLGVTEIWRMESHLR